MGKSVMKRAVATLMAAITILTSLPVESFAATWGLANDSYEESFDVQISYGTGGTATVEQVTEPITEVVDGTEEETGEKVTYTKVEAVADEGYFVSGIAILDENGDELHGEYDRWTREGDMKNTVFKLYHLDQDICVDVKFSKDDTDMYPLQIHIFPGERLSVEDIDCEDIEDWVTEIKAGTEISAIVNDRKDGLLTIGGGIDVKSFNEGLLDNIEKESAEGEPEVFTMPAAPADLYVYEWTERDIEAAADTSDEEEDVLGDEESLTGVTYTDTYPAAVSESAGNGATYTLTYRTMWTDIEKGEADIIITEKDTCGTATEIEDGPEYTIASPQVLTIIIDTSASMWAAASTDSSDARPISSCANPYHYEYYTEELKLTNEDDKAKYSPDGKVAAPSAWQADGVNAQGAAIQFAKQIQYDGNDTEWQTKLSARKTALAGSPLIRYHNGANTRGGKPVNGFTSPTYHHYYKGAPVLDQQYDQSGTLITKQGDKKHYMGNDKVHSLKSMEDSSMDSSMCWTQARAMKEGLKELYKKLSGLDDSKERVRVNLISMNNDAVFALRNINLTQTGGPNVESGGQEAWNYAMECFLVTNEDSLDLLKHAQFDEKKVDWAAYRSTGKLKGNFVDTVYQTNKLAIRDVGEELKAPQNNSQASRYDVGLYAADYMYEHWKDTYGWDTLEYEVDADGNPTTTPKPTYYTTLVIGDGMQTGKNNNTNAFRQPNNTQTKDAGTYADKVRGWSKLYCAPLSYATGATEIGDGTSGADFMNLVLKPENPAKPDDNLNLDIPNGLADIIKLALEGGAGGGGEGAGSSSTREYYITDKVVGAQINKDIFDSWSVGTCNGTVNISSDGAISWSVPTSTEEGQSYSATIHVKMTKDSNRYDIAPGTKYYPCVEGQTPYMKSFKDDGEAKSGKKHAPDWPLLYGTTKIKVDKTWMVNGTEAEDYEISLERQYQGYVTKDYATNEKGEAVVTDFGYTRPIQGNVQGKDSADNDGKNMDAKGLIGKRADGTYGFKGEHIDNAGYLYQYQREYDNAVVPIVVYDNSFCYYEDNPDDGRLTGLNHSTTYYAVYEFYLKETDEQAPFYILKDHVSDIIYSLSHGDDSYLSASDQTERLKKDVQIALSNASFGVKVRTKKIDKDTRQLLHGAIWTIYQWSETNGGYVPYHAKTTKESDDGNSGSIVSNEGEQVYVKEIDHSGEYESTDYLYYSPDNQGHFAAIETTSPAGYIQDWDETTLDEDGNVTDSTRLKLHEFKLPNKTFMAQGRYINILGGDWDSFDEYTGEKETDKFPNTRARIKFLITKNGYITDSNNPSVRVSEAPKENAWYVIRSLQAFDGTASDGGVDVRPIGSLGGSVTAAGDLVSTTARKSLASLYAQFDEDWINDTADAEGYIAVDYVDPTPSDIAEVGEETKLARYIKFTNDGGNVSLSLYDDHKELLNTTTYVYVTEKTSSGDVLADIGEYIFSGAYEIIEVKAPTGFTRVPASIVQVWNGAANLTKIENDVPIKYENADKKYIAGIPEVEDITDPVNYYARVDIIKNTKKETYKPGEEVLYNITVRNTGNVPLYDLDVTDKLTYDGEDTEEKIGHIDNLGLGEFKTLTYKWTVPEEAVGGDIIHNIASVSGYGEATKVVGGEERPDPSKRWWVNDLDDETVKVTGGISLIKRADRQWISPGDSIQYTLLVTNDSEESTSAEVNDDLVSEGAKFVDEKIKGVKESGGTVYIDNIEPGETVILKYIYTLPATSTLEELVNKAAVTSDVGNDSAEISTPVIKPGLKVTKVPNKTTFKVDEVVDYTITAENTGNVDLKDVFLKEMLVDGKWSKESIAKYKDTVDGLHIPSLKKGAKVTVHYLYTVQPSDIVNGGGKVIYNYVQGVGHTDIDDVPDVEVRDNDSAQVITGNKIGIGKIGIRDGLGKFIPGARIAIYAAEDIIRITDGKLLYSEDDKIYDLTTNDTGFLELPDTLPLGHYYMKELKAPDGYYPSDDIIELDCTKYKDEDDIAVVYVGGWFRNTMTQLFLRLHDDDNYNLLAGAKFKFVDDKRQDVTIYDRDGVAHVEFTLPDLEEGYEVNGLKVDGIYRLVETESRVGYTDEIIRGYITGAGTINLHEGKNYIDIKITDNSITSTADGKVEAPEPIYIDITNRFVRGTARLYKDGELLTSWGFTDKIKWFFKSIVGWVKGDLAGVKFKVIAKEDIVHPDGHTGIIYHKDEEVYKGVTSRKMLAEAITDNAGLIVMEDMYLGKYAFVEIDGPDQYIVDDTEHEFTLAYKDKRTGVVDATDGDVKVYNERKHIKIQVYKKDADTGEDLKGAIFGLFAAEDIENYGGEELVKADTLIEQITNDEEGKYIFESDIPVGKYYVREIRAPKGYTKELFRKYIDATGGSEDFVFELTFYDKPIKIIDPPDPDPKTPQMVIEKTAHRTTYKPGEVATYTITVTNTGDYDILNVEVDDVLDYKSELVKEHINTIEKLAIGESKSFIYKWNVPDDAPDGLKVPDRATAEGYVIDEDDNRTDLKVWDDEAIKINDSSLQVVKTADKAVYHKGETIQFTVAVANNADHDLNNVTVTDFLDGIKFVSADITGVTDEGDHVNIKTLEVDRTAILHYTWAVPADYDGATVYNKVKVKCGDDEDEDDVTVRVINPDIEVIKRVSKIHYRPGEVARYTIDVTNTGDIDLQNVRVKEMLIEGKWEETDYENLGGALIIPYLGVNERVTVHYLHTCTEEESNCNVNNHVVAKGDTVEDDDTPPETVEDDDTAVIIVSPEPAFGKAGESHGNNVHILAGAVVGIYAGEDIYDMTTHELVYKKDELIEKITTEFAWTNQPETLLPDGKYYVKEIEPPKGYYPSDQVIELDLTDQSGKTDIEDVTYTGDWFRNQRTRMILRKRDDDTFNVIGGAKFKIVDNMGNTATFIDKSGNEVSEFTVTDSEDGYEINGLEPGVSYSLVEITPRHGYINAIVRAFDKGSGSWSGKLGSKKIGFMLDEVTTSVENYEITNVPEPYELDITNKALLGDVHVKKSGEVLTKWGIPEKIGHFFMTIFNWVKGDLADVTFKVVAKNDIIHPDGKTGIIYHAGETVNMDVDGLRKLAIVTTDKAGYAEFTGLYPGDYELIEVDAPDQYIVDDKPHAFTIKYTDGDDKRIAAISIEVYNERKSVSINIIKKDRDTDKELEGAVFGLYNEDVIYDYNGNETVSANTLLEQITSDENGKYHFEADIPIGRYSVREIKAPEGYTKELFRQYIDATGGNDHYSFTLVFYDKKKEEEDPPNPPKENPSIKVVKTTNQHTYKPGETAKYTITVTNTGDIDAYDIKVTDYMNYKGEILKVDVGVVPKLAPDESYSFTNFTWDVPKNATTGTRVPNRAIAKGYAKGELGKSYPVQDQDDEAIKINDRTIQVIKTSDKTYYHKGDVAFFDVYVVNNNDKIMKNIIVTDYLEGIKYLSSDISGVTDKGDYVVIASLEPGHEAILHYTYTIPNDYEGLTLYNKVKAKCDDDEDEDDVDPPVINPSIKVVKSVEKIHYRVGEVARYTIKVTNDGDMNLKDVEVWERLIKGEWEDEGYEVSGGILTIPYLAIGDSVTLHYLHTCTKDEENKNVNNHVIAEGTTVPDTDDIVPEKVSDDDTEVIVVTPDTILGKVGESEGNAAHFLKGAVIGIYAGEDIYHPTSKEKLYSKDDLVLEYETDNVWWPIDSEIFYDGIYYAKEIKAPDGYYLSDQVIELDLRDQSKKESIDDVKFIGDVFRNRRTRMLLRVRDDSNFNILADTRLQILDSEGNVVTYVSENGVESNAITTTAEERGYIINGLTPGVEYRLVEVRPRDGYVNSIIRAFSKGGGKHKEQSPYGQSIRFSLDDATTSFVDGEIVGYPEDYELDITNRFITGNARIYKTGEILESWTKTDKIKNLFYSIFTYITGNLEGVAFKVIAREDIIHPDGKTGVLYRAGDTVHMGVLFDKAIAEKVTDAGGLASFEGLYPGKYSFVETKAKDGYILDQLPIDFTIIASDPNTPVVEAVEGDAELYNPRKEIFVTILKYDKSNKDAFLRDAEFGLYNKNPIKNGRGIEIVPKNTLLERIGYSEGGYWFRSDLPMGEYYVKELKAPKGYSKATEKKKIDATPGKDSYVFILTFYDKKHKPKKPKKDETKKQTVIRDEIVIDKSGPDKANIGGTMEYTINTLANASEHPMDNFTFEDNLPSGTYLQTLTTGTFNYGLNSTVYYRDALTGSWTLWRQVPSYTSNTLSVQGLPHSQGQDVALIDGIRIVYGTVPAGFALTSPIKYTVAVTPSAGYGATIVNHATGSGDYNGRHYGAEDNVYTTLNIPLLRVPKTGDMSDALLYTVISMILLAIAGFIGFDIRRRRKLLKNRQDR